MVVIVVVIVVSFFCSGEFAGGGDGGDCANRGWEGYEVLTMHELTDKQANRRAVRRDA